MRLENCKVVVTGGAGFVGSHLTETLLKRGCEVTILDNLSTGFPQNISHLLNSGNKLNFIEGDVRDKDVYMKAVKGAQVIFHEAAHINAVLAVENPSYDFEVNARGTFNMLEVARKRARLKTHRTNHTHVRNHGSRRSRYYKTRYNQQEDEPTLGWKRQIPLLPIE